MVDVNEDGTIPRAKLCPVRAILASSITDAEIYAFLDRLGRENVGRSVYVNAGGSLP